MSKIKCGTTAVIHYYLLSYLPLLGGRNPISLSLLNFKQRVQPDLDAWIAYAAEALGTSPLTTDTIITRALRHEETTARRDFPSSLDLLGETLARQFNCQYAPDFIFKTGPTLPSKHLTRRERRIQLAGVYRVADTIARGPATLRGLTVAESGAQNPRFFLIDDILTTGATMRALILALRDAYPGCPITAFTLARADNGRVADPATQEKEAGNVKTLLKRLFTNTF